MFKPHPATMTSATTTACDARPRPLPRPQPRSSSRASPGTPCSSRPSTLVARAHTVAAAHAPDAAAAVVLVCSPLSCALRPPRPLPRPRRALPRLRLVQRPRKTNISTGRSRSRPARVATALEWPTLVPGGRADGHPRCAPARDATVLFAWSARGPTVGAGWPATRSRGQRSTVKNPRLIRIRMV